MPRFCLRRIGPVAIVVIAGGTALVIAAVACTEAVAAKNEHPGSYRTTAEGVPAIHMSAAQRAQTGLETQVLESVSRLPERRAYGTVMSIQPLLELRARYHSLRSNLAVQAAALSASTKNYERVRDLYQDEAVPAGRLQQAKAQWQADRARVAAGRQSLRDLEDAAIADWGKVLGAWALDRQQERLQGLRTGRQVLLLITLPPGQSLPEAADTIVVRRESERQAASKARRLSPAPHTDRSAQGESYFFLCDCAHLRTGMLVDAWIPLSRQPVAGVNLPSSAVVWYAGRPWAYVQVDEQLFSRRLLKTYQDLGAVWFVTGDLASTEIVVATGAQMLLSEELRYRIPNEDDD